MSETKQVKFQFVVDENSARAVHRVLDDMIRKATELGKAMAGMAGQGIMGGTRVGGGTPSPQSTLAGRGGSASMAGPKASFTSVLTGNVDAFKKMAQEGGAAMRVMGDAVTRGITQQQRDINRLKESLDALIRTYDKVGGSASGALGEKIQNKVLQLQARIGSGQRELEKLEALRTPGSSLLPEIPYPGQERKGFGGRAKEWMAERGIYSSPGGGGMIQGLAPTGIGSMLRIGGMALAGADAAFAESRSGTRAYNEAEASRGRLINRRIRASKGGDISDLMALQMMGGMDKADLAKQTGGTGAEAEAFIGGIKKMISRTAGAVTGGLLGEKGGNILGGMTTAEQEQMKSENMFRQVDNFKDTTQYLKRQMAMEQFEGSLQGRIGAAHLMGRKFRKKTSGAIVDDFSNREADLIERGFSTAQEEAAFAQVMGIAGREAAHRRKAEVMSASAAGYGGYGNLVGVSERMGWGNSLARFSMGGGIEKGAGIELGQALLGTGFSAEGMTDRVGTLAALQNSGIFKGGPGDFIGVQEAQAGLQLGSSIMTGQTSPYQRAANLLSARNAGANTSYLQDYIGNQMSFEKKMDIAYGQGTDKTLERFGGDAEMVRRTIGRSLDASLSTVYDKGLEGTPIAETLKKFRASGMSVDDYLIDARKGQRTGEIEDIGVLLGQATGRGQSAGIALAKTVSGMGGAIGEGSVGAGPLDELTASRLKKDADKVREAGQELANNFKSINETFKASGGWEKSLESFGANLGGSAEILRESFANLADAATAAAYKLNPAGNYGGQSKQAPQTKAMAPNKSK